MIRPLIRPSIRPTALAILIGLLGTVSADAVSLGMPTFQKVMAAGRTLRVSSMSAIDQTCRSLGQFTINMIDAPHDGRVEISHGSDFPNFSALNTRSRCNTRKVPATFVSYTPSPAYSGEDEFAIEIVGPMGNVRRARFQISVR